LVIPPVKLVDRGQIAADVMRFILSNTRLPTESAGDFRAQVAANNLATTRLLDLIDQLGRDAFQAYCAQLLAYAERRTRVDLRRLPQGVYRAEDFLDNDGVTDEPVRVAVALIVDEDGVTVDLAGSAEQRLAPINATYSMTYYPGGLGHSDQRRLLSHVSRSGAGGHHRKRPPSGRRGRGVGSLLPRD
jgi:N-methylhydantoinase B